MQLKSAVGLALAALMMGCTGSTTIDDPIGSPTGTVSGSVQLIGAEGLNPAGVRVSLYATVEDYEVRDASYSVPLSRLGATGTTYTFSVTGVAPGTYYMIACFEFGCGDYRDRTTGMLIPVRVDRGRVTNINFSL